MLVPLLKVAGLGDGLFAICFFIGLALFVCFLGAQTTKPGTICFAMALMVMTVILFIVLYPKQGTGTTTTVYDDYSARRVFICLILGVIGVLIVPPLVLKHILQPDIQGHRVYYDNDSHARGHDGNTGYDTFGTFGHRT